MNITSAKSPDDSRQTAVLGLILLIGSWSFVFVRLFRKGRPSRILTYDDVVYFLEGQTLARRIRDEGTISSVWEWASSSPHAPLFELISTLCHLTGLRQPHTTYVIHSVLVMGLITYFVTSSIPNHPYRLHICALFIASPIVSVLANEFRPDSLWITAAGGTLIQAGRMSTGLGQRGARQRKFYVLVFFLCFLKPSWFVFSVMLIAVTTCMRWLIEARINTNSSLLRTIVSDIIVMSSIFGLWMVLVRDEFFIYVLRNVSTDEYLSPSWSRAIFDSITNSLAYLGYPIESLQRILLVLLLFTAIAFALNDTAERQDDGVRSTSPRRSWPSIGLGDSNTLWSSVSIGSLVVSSSMVFATGVSRHPSPFQGLAIVVLATLALIAAFCSLEQNQKDKVRRSHIGLPLALVTIVVALLQWNLMFGGGHTSPELSYPRPASEVLVSAIEDACAPRDMCQSQETVALPFAEELSWESIFYAAGCRQLNLRLVHVDWFSTTISDLLPEIKTATFIVVSERNYEGNRVPINSLQEQIYQDLVSDEQFKKLVTVDRYALFVRKLSES